MAPDDTKDRDDIPAEDMFGRPTDERGGDRSAGPSRAEQSPKPPATGREDQDANRRQQAPGPGEVQGP